VKIRNAWVAFLLSLSGGCAIVPPVPPPEPIPAPQPHPDPSPTPDPTPDEKIAPVAVLSVVVTGAGLETLIPLGEPFQHYVRVDGIEVRSYRVRGEDNRVHNAHVQIKDGKIAAPPEVR